MDVGGGVKLYGAKFKIHDLKIQVSLLEDIERGRDGVDEHFNLKKQFQY